MTRAETDAFISSRPPVGDDAVTGDFDARGNGRFYLFTSHRSVTTRSSRRVSCVDNSAQFTVAGGGNNSVVKIKGFTRFGKLSVEELRDGEWTGVGLASVWGYDGYGVQYEADGTYTYSFVYDSDGTARTFRATVG